MAKSRTDVELGLACCDKFFDCAKSNCIEKSMDKTQRRVLKCGKKMQTWTRARGDWGAAEKDQKSVNFHENLKSTRKLVASGNSDIDGTGTIWPHNLHISTAYVPHLEKVFSNARQRYSPEQVDKMECLCPLLFKVQFNLGKITQSIHVPSRIKLNDD